MIMFATIFPDEEVCDVLKAVGAKIGTVHYKHCTFSLYPFAIVDTYLVSAYITRVKIYA